jgi:hypothetical protein
VGNWEPWPTVGESSTTGYLTRTVYLSTTIYLDENSDGVWDANEITASEPVIRWRSQSGTIITETRKASWVVAKRVKTGGYILEAHAPQYLLQRTYFDVLENPNTQSLSKTLGLKPIRAQTFLPIIARSASP